MAEAPFSLSYRLLAYRATAQSLFARIFLNSARMGQKNQFTAEPAESAEFTIFSLRPQRALR